MKRGITFGIFDVFHYGHRRILEPTRELCDHMVVGVSSDELYQPRTPAILRTAISERIRS